MSRIMLFVALASALFGLLIVLEILQSEEPLSWPGLALDLFETALLAGAVAFTAFGAQAGRELRRERARLLGDLERARKEGEHWRVSSRAHVEGLSRAMAAQFAAWGLTEAERDVALLMLKGLSHKEIATLRDCSSATVRQHAAAIYRKSGLTSRSQLTGFFLEDLLAPARDRGGLSVVASATPPGG